MSLISEDTHTRISLFNLDEINLGDFYPNNNGKGLVLHLLNNILRKVLFNYAHSALFVDHFKSQDVDGELFLFDFQSCTCMQRTHWRGKTKEQISRERP